MPVFLQVERGNLQPLELDCHIYSTSFIYLRKLFIKTWIILL